MAESWCPICYGPLEVRDVAPCYDCGHDPTELQHLREGKHTYAEMRIFGAAIILCNFCQADFFSYDLEYFGRARARFPGREMVFVRDVLSVNAVKDKYCTACGRRLAFLRFLAEVRDTATI